MKFYSYLLFYLFAVMFLIIGILSQLFLYYFISALITFIIGYTFQRKQVSLSPVKRGYIITVLIVWIPGILFTASLFHIVFIMATNAIPDPSAISMDGPSLIMVILGPSLLLASIIIFIISLIKTKKIK